MTTILERFDSREITVSGDGSSADLVYSVTGSEDENEVLTTVQGSLPATYLGLTLQSYHLAPQGGGIWEVTARYGIQTSQATGESAFAFDTGGGTTHITQSLLTVGTYAAAGASAPNCQGAIGVNGDSVEGTDITVPVYSFTETHYLSTAVVTGAYKTTLFSLTGRVNNAAFRGFAAGEVLFQGASGSQRGTDRWEITFRFAASPNVTGLGAGQITGISKKGWEYLWVRYADATDQNMLVKQPVAAYVEQVYPSGNFALLGI